MEYDIVSIIATLEEYNRNEQNPKFKDINTYHCILSLCKEILYLEKAIEVLDRENNPEHYL